MPKMNDRFVGMSDVAILRRCSSCFSNLQARHGGTPGQSLLKQGGCQIGGLWLVDERAGSGDEPVAGLCQGPTEAGTMAAACPVAAGATAERDGLLIVAVW